MDSVKLHGYMLEHGVRQDALDKELLAEIGEKEMGVMAGCVDGSALFVLLLELLQAKKVIEVGVFRGSTTLKLAQALPSDGKVYGLDISKEYTQTARKYWKKAGVEEKIELLIAPAKESMQTLLLDGFFSLRVKPLRLSRLALPVRLYKISPPKL